MNKYSFSPSDHNYKDQNGKSGISTTTLVEKYSSEFKEDYWLMWKAWEMALCKGTDKQMKSQFRNIRNTTLDKKYQIGDVRMFDALRKRYPSIGYNTINKNISHLKLKWEKTNKESIIKGTAYHNAKEADSINRRYEVNPFTGEMFKVIVPYKWKKGIKYSTVDLLNLEEGFYPEIIVYYDGIFGQIDRLWVKANRRIWIRDHKTNKEIKQSNRFQNMKHPLSFLEDCNYNHYRVQLSIYGWILISLGYMLEELAIDHHNEEYILEYLPEVEDLIIDYKLTGLDDVI